MHSHISRRPNKRPRWMNHGVAEWLKHSKAPPVEKIRQCGFTEHNMVKAFWAFTVTPKVKRARRERIWRYLAKRGGN